jgi:hypothetical protein
MTFWTFFDNSPVSGLLFALAAIYGATSVATGFISGLFGVLRARYVPYAECDCVPCQCPPGCHDEEDEEEDEDASTQPESVGEGSK